MNIFFILALDSSLVSAQTYWGRSADGTNWYFEYDSYYWNVVKLTDASGRSLGKFLYDSENNTSYFYDNEGNPIPSNHRVGNIFAMSKNRNSSKVSNSNRSVIRDVDTGGGVPNVKYQSTLSFQEVDLSPLDRLLEIQKQYRKEAERYKRQYEDLQLVCIKTGDARDCAAAKYALELWGQALDNAR